MHPMVKPDRSCKSEAYCSTNIILNFLLSTHRFQCPNCKVDDERRTRNRVSMNLVRVVGVVFELSYNLLVVRTVNAWSAFIFALNKPSVQIVRVRFVCATVSIDDVRSGIEYFSKNYNVFKSRFKQSRSSCTIETRRFCC